jgi:thioredoxin-like negative regulator of GroEL
MEERNEETVEIDQLSMEKPVVVMIGQSTCPPCQATGPIFTKLIAKYKTKKLGYVELEENREFADSHEVKVIPLFIMFHKGEEVRRMVGSKSEEELIEFIGEDNG